MTLQGASVPPTKHAPTVAGGPAPAGEQSHCETEYKDSSAETGDETGLTPVSPELERRVVLEFSVSKSFMGKLARFRSLMWHRLPANATLEQVFQLMLDQSLDQTDPAAREERRRRRDEKKSASMSRAPAARTVGATRDTRNNPRQIPARVRDAVFLRDSGKCAFVGKTGRKCESTTALQVDHVVPVARGGAATPDNLRLLCAYHNRLEAERLLGKRMPVGRGSTTRVDAGPGGSSL
jgi:5-methylcytosine-specific restriction endonuclease McrA